jgi:Heparinase II/III-like protein
MPAIMPVHARGDTFGCVVHVAKVPLQTDTGSSTYEPGAVRRYEESTAGYSALQVGGADSTEVRGCISGRTASPGLVVSPFTLALLASPVKLSVTGSDACPPRGYRRRWSITSDELWVEGTVTAEDDTRSSSDGGLRSAQRCIPPTELRSSLTPSALCRDHRGQRPCAPDGRDQAGCSRVRERHRCIRTDQSDRRGFTGPGHHHLEPRMRPFARRRDVMKQNPTAGQRFG